MPDNQNGKEIDFIGPNPTQTTGKDSANADPVVTIRGLPVLLEDMALSNLPKIDDQWISSSRYSFSEFHMKAYGEHLFVWDSSSNELVVYDISDPINLTEVSRVSSVSMDTGGISDDGSVLAWSYNSNGLKVKLYNISSPSSTSEVSTIDVASHTSNTSGFAKMISITNDILVVGESNTDFDQFALFDVSDPANPTFEKEVTYQGEYIDFSTRGGAKGNYVFYVTQNGLNWATFYLGSISNFGYIGEQEPPQYIRLGESTDGLAYDPTSNKMHVLSQEDSNGNPKIITYKISNV